MVLQLPMAATNRCEVTDGHVALTAPLTLTCLALSHRARSKGLTGPFHVKSSRGRHAGLADFNQIWWVCSLASW
ncbi:hypothetical protein JTE90_025805 [Oedothorax gibbosus]|uniref:Uncharacterized protein n=1 Tax=Oedothorax gibbosus TaxID=931172 RepID=A0AAV6TPU1_9ARAC|nr:hypothetical protein JTE90_025805 [Oedothorax gibbosus]